MYKISDKILAEFQKAIDAYDLKSVSEDKSFDGTFEVVASTQSMDRQGEIVLQAGLNTENYMLNPVILAFHDYSSLPIGIATSVEKQADKTIIKGKFVSADINPFAQVIRKLYDCGALKTVSIGFIAKQWEGNVITESELLELSFVPVPANQDALAIGKEAKLDEKEMALLVEKSVRKEEKKVTNSDLKAHVKEMIEKMCANHKEMCDKHDIMMTKLEEISNSAKSFAAELVDLKQAGVVGSGEKDQAQKLEELSIASARISSEIRTILKSGSATK